MGRIKSMVIKRTSRQLVDTDESLFAKDFETNKKVLGNTLPSKRMKNKIAGYITRLKKNKKTIIDDEDGTKTK